MQFLEYQPIGDAFGNEMTSSRVRDMGMAAGGVFPREIQGLAVAALECHGSHGHADAFSARKMRRGGVGQPG